MRLAIPLAVPLAGLALLAGCAGEAGCNSRVTVSNASARVVEQVYLGASDAGGPDLLGTAEIPPGGRQTVQAQIPKPATVRVVWADGYAATLTADFCSRSGVTVLNDGLRAE